MVLLAIYTRVSTGMQIEGTSLESQYELCIKKAKEMDFSEEQIKVYEEGGASGEDIDRPMMNQLRQDAAMGLISHVMCTHPDRLSRDLTDKLIVCREFEKRNIEMIFVDTEYKDTPEGKLFFNMQSTIAQYELEMIKKRTVRGRLKVVEKEKKVMPMRVPPYGYDWKDGRLTINECEAMYVKLIYDWYVFNKYTMRQIGEKLYSLGAIPKRGESRNWNASSIMRVLTSEIYIGKYYYNRRETKKIRGEKTAKGNPKIEYTKRPKEDWLMVQVPAIIDENTFMLAQSQRKKNTKKSGNVKHQYLLRSLIRCGECGRVWQSTSYTGRVKQTGEKTSYPCYRCPNKNPKIYGEIRHKCKSSKTIRAEILDQHVWELISDVILNPENIIKRRTEIDSNIINESQSVVEVLKKQIERLEKEKEQIKTMFRREVISEDEMISDMKKVNTEISKIQSEIEDLNRQIKNQQLKDLTHDKIVEMLSKCKDVIKQGEATGLTHEQKREIVEMLVSEVIVKYEDDHVKITCLGIIDKLLSTNQNVGICSQFQKI